MRTILHIDANAFYCACHEKMDPRLRDVPICVGGRRVEDSSRTPIIVTANYVARGINPRVRAGMTVPEAERLVPGLMVIEPDFDLYRRFSRDMLSVISIYTPVIEPVSIDEAFADVTGCPGLRAMDPVALALQLKSDIRERVGIPVSIGISSNKLLAKQASDLRKPDAVTPLFPEDVPSRLWPLPVGDLYGCGSKSAEKLERLGIRTIGDLAAIAEDRLARFFGPSALKYLLRAANGVDDSSVNPHRHDEVKSVSNSTTLPHDTSDATELHRALLALCDTVGRRIRRHGYKGRTVTVTIRDAKRRDIQRSRTLETEIDLTSDLYAVIAPLFDRHWNGQPVRLLGVAVSQLRPVGQSPSEAWSGAQLDLFESGPSAVSEPVVDGERKERARKLTDTMDQIRDRYGEQALLPARLLGPGAGTELLDRKARGTSLEKDSFRQTDDPDRI